MPNRVITSRLASHGGIRQIEAWIRAKSAATATDRVIGGVWQELIELLKAA